MTETTVKGRVSEQDKRKYRLLSRVAKVASKYYYCRSEDLIDDATFDRLMDKLEEMEALFPELATSDSPTRAVGAPIEETVRQGKAQMFVHKSPQLSLKRAKTFESIEEFMRRVHTPLTVEEKIDGLTAVAVYKGGKLEALGTRGDGRIGLNLTRNVDAIIDLPKQLPVETDLAVRLEIFCTYQNLQVLNKRQAAMSRAPFKTCRAAASAILQSAEPPRGVLSCKVTEQAYPGESGAHGTSHYKFLGWCDELGLRTVTRALVKRWSGLREAAAMTDTLREEAPYPTDGLVFKADDYAERAYLGETGSYPHWAYSYKVRGIDRSKEYAA